MRKMSEAVRDSDLRLCILGNLESFPQDHQQELQEFRQRQVERDQRFNVLLQDLRYLIQQ